MDKKISVTSYIAIGLMLFALFFGAGNLIFPAELGQYAGENLWLAILGFLITGVGLPLLGILAIGYSGSESLQQLAGRVHPKYGVIFTVMLYLTIGPFFAAPRTGAVAYDIAMRPFVAEEYTNLMLFLFTAIFFTVTVILSLKPTKVVDRVGKVLSPTIIGLLLILLGVVIFKPMASIGDAHEPYIANQFFTGFTEGYNTMDALGSLVYGVIIINVVRSLGVTSKAGIVKATLKTGLVATFFLALIYTGIAYLGATTAPRLGLLDTGGQVLSETASYYFGSFGLLLLAVVIILACLTTAIGLMTACGEYFHSLFPRISYQTFVILFTSFCFAVSNVGLSNIIMYSVPLLMLLYPLAISLMILAFVSPFFNHSKIVYITTTIVMFAISLVDGLKTLCESLGIEYFTWLAPIIDFYSDTLPLYNDGLGWLIPFIIVLIVTTIYVRVMGYSTEQEQLSSEM